MLKPLPVGTQTFRKIVKGGFLYVDKTEYLYQLVRHPIGVYFFAHPRRFGKSLLISTLAEILDGQKKLFQNLWIYESDYAWERYAVIHFDFSRHHIGNVDDLKASIKRQLRHTARRYQIELADEPYDYQFEDLLMALAEDRKVAILIGEYDKPIIDHIENLNQAQAIRDVLKSFYSLIKSMDAYHPKVNIAK